MQHPVSKNVGITLLNYCIIPQSICLMNSSKTLANECAEKCEVPLYSLSGTSIHDLSWLGTLGQCGLLEQIVSQGSHTQAKPLITYNNQCQDEITGCVK